MRPTAAGTCLEEWNLLVHLSLMEEESLITGPRDAVAELKHAEQVAD